MAEISNMGIQRIPGNLSKNIETDVKPGSGPSFKEALNEAEGVKGLPQTEPTIKTLSFSNHAVERMSQRGMAFTPEQMTEIEAAVNKAAEKGAKESLVIANDSAMIVNVNNRKVVTVMDRNALKENVFTNIDSTVFI